MLRRRALAVGRNDAAVLRPAGSAAGSLGSSIDVQVAAVPAFLRQVGEALHFDSLRVVGVALDFEVAGLRAVLGAGVELERVLADAQRQRQLAVDVEVAAELGRVRQTSSVTGRPREFLQVHPRGNRLAGLAVDDFDRAAGRRRAGRHRSTARTQPLQRASKTPR